MNDVGFKLVSEFAPRGDQPQAITKLTQGLRQGLQKQTLKGATGTGKTFVIAHVIQSAQKPTLVVSHNKTLASQLYGEFKAFFPKNAVEYFVSYYDYYQPEAYVPQTDTYIAKDVSINEEIDRLRHSATQSLLSRRDVIVVASVSCLYGLGSPQEYLEETFQLKKGQTISRSEILRKLVDMQYERNDVTLSRGRFRARGGMVEVCPSNREVVIRIEIDGDKVAWMTELDPVTGSKLEERDYVWLFPSRHFVTSKERLGGVLESIYLELQDRLRELKSQGKLLEAQRLEQRTNYDLEMIREIGYCTGIENYSRHFDGRQPGEPPHTLVDYFPSDFLTIIDESHVTVPQIEGMYGGDLSRKETLVAHGFRLPSAKDNRPLKFDEFFSKLGQIVFMSATPSPLELSTSAQVVEQIIRPTGLVDPEIIVKPVKGQVEDLTDEIKARTSRNEKTLVTTLTKRMAENLAEYLAEQGIKVHYLHSEIETLDRVEILKDLRLGKYDAIVGINLLREGLDLPEVSLVAILDADSEGFLRSQTSLVQTIGRAARNISGQVIMYADQMTDSMRDAIDETNRRRTIQVAYNREHNIIPETIRKEVRDIMGALRPGGEGAYLAARAAPQPKVSKHKLEAILATLQDEMLIAAQNLEFERAAEIRDKIKELKQGVIRVGR